MKNSPQIYCLVSVDYELFLDRNYKGHDEALFNPSQELMTTSEEVNVPIIFLQMSVLYGRIENMVLMNMLTSLKVRCVQLFETAMMFSFTCILTGFTPLTRKVNGPFLQNICICLNVVLAKANVNDRKALKGLRWLLYRHSSTRSRKDTRTLRPLDKDNRRIYRAWCLKDEFERLWNYNARWAAERFLTGWMTAVRRSRLEPMNKFVETVNSTTMESWHSSTRA